MEWTYLSYTLVNYGVSLGLVLAAIASVFAIFFSSRKGQEFVIERLIGVNPTKAHDDSHELDVSQANVKDDPADINRQHPKSKQKPVHTKQKPIFYIGICFCLLGGTTLSITGVLLFQGCFLTNARVLPDDDCPEFPVDCFVFGRSGFAPIHNNVSFYCKRSERALFPNNNTSDATAWCYGWIIRLQTTKSVLDQLGVAIALIGFFTTMLAVIVYLGKCKKTVILSIILISICTGVIAVLLFYQWSFAPLTYAILSLGIGLGVFGLILFYILPRPARPKDNGQASATNISRPGVIASSNLSDSKQSASRAAAPFHVNLKHQSSKIVPE